MQDIFTPTVFIKPVDPDIRKCKLLFLMGATLNNKSMFDLDSNEDSFAVLLQKRNIETYTFDNIGLSNPPLGVEVGDQHFNNVSYARKIIIENNIEYVLGYSYGAIILNELLTNLPECVKGIIFLDPYTKLKDIQILNQISLDNNDKRAFTKPQLLEFLEINNANINPNILEYYSNNFNPSITLACYPSIYYRNFTTDTYNQFIEKTRNSKRKVRMYFTHHPSNLEPMIGGDIKRIFPKASHWILVEDDRFPLADDVLDFINQN